MNCTSTSGVTEESIPHSSSSWCTSEANWVALVPWVQRIGTSSPPSMASTDVPCVTSYPPLGSLSPVLDGHGQVLADVDDRVERPGEPDERRVEPVEVVAQHLLGVALGVRGHEHHVDLLVVRLVEPGHRRGQRGQHDLADVRAVGVAEEHEGQALVGVVGEGVRRPVGVGQRRRGHDVRLVEHRTGERRVVVAAAGGQQERGREQHDRERAAGPTGHGGPRRRGRRSGSRGRSDLRRRRRRGRGGYARRRCRRSRRRRRRPPRRPGRRC